MGWRLSARYVGMQATTASAAIKGGFKSAGEDNTRYQLIVSTSQTVQSTSSHPCETTAQFLPELILFGLSQSLCALCVSMLPPAHWEPKQFLSSLQLTHIQQCPPLLPVKTKSFPSSFHNNSHFSHAPLSEDLSGVRQAIEPQKCQK